LKPSKIDEDGFEDLGDYVGSKYYKPTREDFMLLKGSLEWN
jgi:hypothetical protein